MRGRRWFVRRRIGLGWRPATWQGWATTAVAAAGVIATVITFGKSPARVPVVLVIVAAYTAVAVATGGRHRAEQAPAAVEEPVPEPARESEGVDEGQREALRSLTTQRAGGAGNGPALLVEQLTKRFGDRVAVDDVSFSVDVGEVFGFLGPNGAGKTTTVRMLATLLAPTSGSAIVAGLALERANGVAIRQRVAVMPENPGLYTRLTVAENLEFFAGLYAVDDPAGAIRRALAAVNLSSRANDPCGSLSKGLRQRVALARVLLGEPAILFLDEPTSGLDPVASREVHDLIDALRERGVTIFLTTHRLEEAERLCDRVAILNTSMRTIGRPDELRDRLFPRTLLVRTAAPLQDPAAVFAVSGVTSWRDDHDGGYALEVEDARGAAPDVTRALVASGADVLSVTQAQHSLEDVYLELVDDKTRAPS